MKAIRPYQQSAIVSVNSLLEKGVNSMALVLATGTGKTFTCAQILKQFNKILFIASTEELIEQGSSALMFELGEANFGIIKGDQFDISHRITLASAQTLHRRLNLLKSDLFDVVVCDECDLFGAKSFRASVDHFTPKLRLGLTATFFRMDNLPMTDIFSEVAFEYPIHTAVKEGYLTKPIVIKLKTSANLDSVHTLAGEFNQKELTEKVNTPERNNQIVSAYIEHGQGRQFIAFCCDVQHTIDLCDTFTERGIDCKFVVGDKEFTTDRKGIIESYKNGETLGLTNCNILVAGFDHPDTGVLIMACPTKSRRKFIQQIGRGFRLKSEEFVIRNGQNVIIIDVVDGSTKHKLINTDELDSDLDLEDKIFISDVNRKKLMDAKAKRETQMTSLFRDKDEISELFPLPKVKVIWSARGDVPATEAQLFAIERVGYDIKNNTYTKFQCMQIIASQQASREDVMNLKSAGYDISGGVTRSQAEQAFKDITRRDLLKLRK